MQSTTYRALRARSTTPLNYPLAIGLSRVDSITGRLVKIVDRGKILRENLSGLHFREEA